MIATMGGTGAFIFVVFVIMQTLTCNPKKDSLRARSRGEASTRQNDRRERELRLKAELEDWKRERAAQWEREHATPDAPTEPIPPVEESAPIPLDVPEPPPVPKVRKPRERKADPVAVVTPDPTPVPPAPKVRAEPVPAKVPATPPVRKREVAPTARPAIAPESVTVYATDGKADEYARILAQYATECAARRKESA